MTSQRQPAAPDVQAFLDSIAGQPPFRSLPIADARAAVRQIAAALDLPPDPSVESEGISLDIDGIRQLRARVFVPVGATVPGPTIVYFHGGGWTTGDIDTHDSLCRSIAACTKLRLLSVDYRLAPEATFPSAYDDALAATRLVLSETLPQLVGTRGVIVAGDSAGGGLAAAVAHQLRSDGGVRAQLLLYPVLDVAGRGGSYSECAEGYLLEAADMESFIDAYVPERSQRSDWRCSPLLAESFEKLPPLALLTCGLDPLRDEGRSYAARCVQAGVAVNFVEAPGHMHGVAMLRHAIPSSQRILERVCTGLMTLL
ncbi:alpha/beta hydrolase [Steroidobacter sp.]|uniref:alpha/beta hydrolase n=1 Tax=Steroidobacter sp. TaxID=1978227 RepID=UPI001A5608A2|nr:alpha/beta hydrolase [Steroidobacter sp.]MBL8265187.1 alpha/beta hydrolase [Steroidobacter sp.]